VEEPSIPSQILQSVHSASVLLTYTLYHHATTMSDSRVPRAYPRPLLLLQNFAFSIVSAQFGGRGAGRSSESSELNTATPPSNTSSATMSVSANFTAFSRIQESVNLFFTAVFTFELALNLYAYWFRPIFKNGWVRTCTTITRAVNIESSAVSYQLLHTSFFDHSPC
jgi:hypothetical protein